MSPKLVLSTVCIVICFAAMFAWISHDSSTKKIVSWLNINPQKVTHGKDIITSKNWVNIKNNVKHAQNFFLEKCHTSKEAAVDEMEDIIQSIDQSKNINKAITFLGGTEKREYFLHNYLGLALAHIKQQHTRLTDEDWEYVKEDTQKLVEVMSKKYNISQANCIHRLKNSVKEAYLQHYLHQTWHATRHKLISKWEKIDLHEIEHEKSKFDKVNLALQTNYGLTAKKAQEVIYEWLEKKEGESFG